MVFLVGVVAVLALFWCLELARDLRVLQARLDAIERLLRRPAHPAAAPDPRAPSESTPAEPTATVAALEQAVQRRDEPAATPSTAPPGAGAPVPAGVPIGAPAGSPSLGVAGPALAAAATPPKAASEPSSPPAPAPARHEPSMDWERWLGVRGAAVLGGVALALASIFLFNYAVEHGHLTPTMRLSLGSGAGLACLLGSTGLLRRGYAWPAHALAGAGLVAFYAVIWAARELYGFLAMPVAFAGMVLVTVLACVLAHRRASALIAALALVGGFATPLLVRGTSEEPIGLFGYLLLLDAGLLYLLRRHRWPWLGGACLLLSVAWQAYWIGLRMPPAQFGLGLGILLAFAVLFAASARDLLTRAAALFLPFAFALHLSSRADLGPHLWPVAGLLVVLIGAIAWLASRAGQPHLVTAAAAAAAALGACGPWLGRVQLDTALAWEAVASLAAFAIPGLVLRQWGAVLVSTLGGLVLLAPTAVQTGAVVPWPWWCGGVALAGAAWWAGAAPGRAWARIAAALALGSLLALHGQAHATEPAAVSQRVLGPLGLGLAVAVLLSANAHRASPRVRWCALAGAFVLPLLLALPLRSSAAASDLGVWAFHGLALAFAVVAALAATWAGSSVGLGLATAQAAFVAMFWPRAVAGVTAVWLQLAAVAVFGLWPAVWPRPFRTQRGGWRAAALAPILFWPTLFWHAEPAWGEATLERLALAVGSITAAAAWRASRLWPVDNPLRTSALAWLGGVGAMALAAAVPQPVVALAWMPRLALQLVLIAALWRSVDHVGLKVLTFVLALAVASTAVSHPVVASSAPRPASIVWNQLHYVYGVAALAMLTTAWLFLRRERPRLRSYEPQAVIGPVTSVLTVLVGFVWINVGVALLFATGDRVAVSFASYPARDLTTSVAWIVYALVLLGIGVGGRSAALRWVSLILMLLSIGKVFLHDLGELTDLYRVASLAGLALSLLLISVLYQRFVFRPVRPPA